ncbi:hypothetical protein SK128_010483 [Halocaridina rubra]|uniref:Uncharacterized protein n=1 Tax=Halocaridina rubra TaxID=373956 RepID=A0AAN8XL03_HALRR
MNISTGQILAVTTVLDAKRLGLEAMYAATMTYEDKTVQPKTEAFASCLKKKTHHTWAEYIWPTLGKESSWPNGFCLILGVDTQAMRVTQTEHTNVDDLFCPNHEEADARIFAHIASCDNNSVVVNQATDTDIIVLSIYHFPRLLSVVEL